jgi:hypothetical protein
LARGFSFVELVVSMAIMLSVTGSMFGIINAARAVFESDLERADMQQRARVSMDALFRDLVMAGAGGLAPAVAPYRRGTTNPDPPGSAFSDRLSVMYAPPDPAAGTRLTSTYALRVIGGVPKLSRYDGLSMDLPVADHVVALRFEYFDAAGQPMTLHRFMDGPWVPHAVAVDRFDVDLQAIRRVRALVRFRANRQLIGMPVADLDVAIDVSPRNLTVQ